MVLHAGLECSILDLTETRIRYGVSLNGLSTGIARRLLFILCYVAKDFIVRIYRFTIAKTFFRCV